MIAEAPVRAPACVQLRETVIRRLRALGLFWHVCRDNDQAIATCPVCWEPPPDHLAVTFDGQWIDFRCSRGCPAGTVAAALGVRTVW